MNCYMDRPEELEKYAGICKANGFRVPQNGARGLCEAMAGGDANVFDVIWKIWNFENVFDDLIDQPGVTDDLKILALNTLHDAVVEAIDDKHGPAYTRLLHMCAHLERRTNWSQIRKALSVGAVTAFFLMLETNPFVLDHRQQFKAMLVQTMLRCIAGDLMAKSRNERERALAPAVRCGDVDLFMHIIYLARGFAAATAWCGKLGYDLADGPSTKETI